MVCARLPGGGARWTVPIVHSGPGSPVVSLGWPWDDPDRKYPDHLTRLQMGGGGGARGVMRRSRADGGADWGGGGGSMWLMMRSRADGCSDWRSALKMQPCEVADVLRSQQRPPC